MKSFGGHELRTFLAAVDRHLTGPVDIRVIGGAAAVLSERLSSATQDVDLKSISAPDIDVAGSVARLEEACRKAREETGLVIPVSSVGIWDAPWDFESRFYKAPIPKLKKLAVWVPDRYDWALMKTVRLDEKDAAHIREAHTRKPFDRKVLLKRFIEEMTHISPSERLGRHFLMLIEDLFGEKEAARMEAKIRTLPEWKSM